MFEASYSIAFGSVANFLVSFLQVSAEAFHITRLQVEGLRFESSEC